MEKCDERGSYRGSCCCNCKYQTLLCKHPGNKEPLFKGSISEGVAWGCTSFFVAHQLAKIEGVQTQGEIGTTLIFESEHGMCEEHEKR
jgi:hypothetical protein